MVKVKSYMSKIICESFNLIQLLTKRESHFLDDLEQENTEAPNEKMTHSAREVTLDSLAQLEI